MTGEEEEEEVDESDKHTYISHSTSHGNERLLVGRVTPLSV